MAHLILSIVLAIILSTQGLGRPMTLTELLENQAATLDVDNHTPQAESAKLEVSSSAYQMVLSLDFPQYTPPAGVIIPFKNKLLVFFSDLKAPISWQNPAVENSQIIDKIVSLPLNGPGQGADIIFQGSYMVSASRHKNKLKLFIPYGLLPEYILPLTLKREETVEDGHYITRISVTSLQAPQTFTHNGENWVLVPATQPHTALTQGYETPAYEIMPSLQGLLIRLKTPAVKVKLEAGNVVIKAPLLLQAAPYMEKSIKEGTDEAPKQSIALLDNWQHLYDPTLSKKGDYLYAWTAASDERVYGAIENVMTYYLINGYATEALGLLRILENKGPTLAQKKRLKLVEGIAASLAAQPEHAYLAFRDAQLEGDRELTLWLNVLKAVITDTIDEKMVKGIREAGEIIRKYPPIIRNFVALHVIEAMLRQGIEFEKTEFGWIDLANFTPQQARHYQFVKILDAFQRAPKNQKPFEQLTNFSRAKDDIFAMRAKLFELDYRIKAQNLAVAKQIEVLRDLLTHWRGGNLESTVLERLAHLYYQQGAYQEVLEVLSKLLRLYPHYQSRQGLYQMGVTSLTKLLAPQNNIAPLEALGAYQRYQEFIPQTKINSPMMQYLITRLVQADLLEAAGYMLKPYLSSRWLTQSERINYATTYGLILIMQFNYEEALKILSKPSTVPLKAKLRHKRHRLKFYALVKLHRYKDALEHLKQDTSEEALYLQLLILQRMEAWQRLVELTSSAIEKQKIANKVDPYIIILKATGLFFQQRKEDLKVLRTTFKEIMEKSPYAQLFQILTIPEYTPNFKKADILEKIARVETFDKLVDKYQADLQAGQL